MADVKWIKITTDIFDDEKILLIESLPDAYAIITCWFKLLCLAGKMNNSGVFMMNNSIAYTDKMLSTIFRMKETTVQLALNTFEEFGMIEMIDGIITIPNWDKHQSLDALEKKREYQKEWIKEKRAKQKLIVDNCRFDSRFDSRVDVDTVEEDIDKNKNKNKSRLDYNSIVNKFNDICVSLPKVTVLTDKRKKAMDRVFVKDSVISVDYLDILLPKVEASDFLTGRTGTWKANFDWLMNPTNIAKVIDGNYENRDTVKKTQGSGNVFLDIAREGDIYG